MTGCFTAACVQFTAANEFAPNIAALGNLVRQARDKGADFIALPENAGMMEPNAKAHLAKATDEAANPVLEALRGLAQQTGAWILIGSLAVKLDDARLANRSFLLAPDGSITARYDKIHMFDVDLGDGEQYRESRLFQPGMAARLAALPWGRLGMTICYDVRFAYLYRALAAASADFITVPAAFTVPTGTAHWHVLLRARAIETGCFVIAPAQWGEHAGGRRTFGHSLIVDPWGVVLADAGEGVGIVTARIDPARVAKARAMVPSLRHDRNVPAPERL